MKKILSLFSLLMLFVVGASAEKVTYALAVDEAHKAGESVDVKNGEDVVATLTFGFAGEADFNKAAKDGSVEGFEAYTSGNGVNGSEKAGSNYIIIPKYDGKVSAAVVLNANKSFFVTEDGTALEAYNGIKKDTKYYGTFEFDVKAGKTYKVYCTGSKLGFYGFTYEFEAAAQPIKFDVTYALAVDETHKAGESVDVKNGDDVVATLTFGFAGEADFNKAAKDGSVEGFEAYTSGNGVNGSEKAGSNYIIIPKYDGKVSAAVVLNANKSFFVTEDGTALEAYNGIKKDAKYYGTFEFDVKAGKTYKVYCTGSKLGFYGFTYSVDIAAEEDYDDGDFAAYSSLDFNSCAGGAVSRGGRHAGDITAAMTITDADGNSLEITPNTDATNYPDGAEPCSKFIETMAGPQLLVSGGYSGVTLHVKGTAINEIALNVTNWNRAMIATDNTIASTDAITYEGADYSVKHYNTIGTLSEPEGNVITWKTKEGEGPYTDVYFIVKADTTWTGHWETLKDKSKKWVRDEIVLNGMGTMKINSIVINPQYDVVVDAVTGTDLAAQIAAAYATIKNPKSLTVNLTAGETYTASSSISLDGSVPFTINGNGATIDASENEGAFIQMAATPAVEKNANEAYLTEPINIKDVTINDIQSYLIYYSGSVKCVVKDFTVDNSIVKMATAKDLTAFIRLNDGQSGIKDLTIKNSTFYQTGEKNCQYFVQYSQGDPARWGLATDETWSFNYYNNTFYKVGTGNWANTSRTNNVKPRTIFNVEKNIWVDCGNGQIAQRMVNQQTGFKVTNFVSNTYWYNGAAVNQSNYTNGETALTTAPVFADAAKGDFTLGDCAQKTAETGDPRWIGGGSGAITGIEAVKEAKTAEDGAWYTIQGQRVAQPTKGLYIHNGKKVVIK